MTNNASLTVYWRRYTIILIFSPFDSVIVMHFHLNALYFFFQTKINQIYSLSSKWGMHKTMVFFSFFFFAKPGPHSTPLPPPPKKKKIMIITFKHKCANYCWPFIFIIVHFHSLLLCFLSLRTYCYHFSLFRDVWRRYLF